MDKAACGIPSEADLQRACGTLYITHGLESTCGLVMFVFFAIVAVKLHCRSHLHSPALAFIRFFIYHVYTFIDEFLTTLYTVGQMDEVKLEARLRFCGNLDKMANATSAVLSLLGITRWLSIGNVNGMRYIGYALTCPMTQVELVAMLAPIIPCYRLCAFTSFFLTVMTLTMGYVASLFEMPVYEGDVFVFLRTWDVDDFAPTTKFAIVGPALIGISTLWVIVLPYLMLTYTCHGGNSNPDLPQEYRFLVSMVWITWLCFPVWWFLSWEGNAVITDTKFNEIGFTFLNMTAKGLFTLQSFRVGELADERMAARRGNNKKGNKRGSDGQCLENQGSNLSEEGEWVPPIISRASSKKLSKSQFVKVLRSYDCDSDDSSEESDNDGRRSDDDTRKRGANAGQSRDRSRTPDSRHQGDKRNQQDRRDQRGQCDPRDQRGQWDRRDQRDQWDQRDRHCQVDQRNYY